ncbi:MAG: DNA repair protein RecO [Candidatus Zixiibacteriota bacterium]|nr:MAG: DNA repair protein RecO [candidate division Zixibacteria bacterium]
MSLEKTEVVMLKAFNWSESSRTVHFFSREFGRLPLVDRAGRKLTSKRGRLLPFARMEVTFYGSKKGTAGYVSDVELLETFSLDAEGTLGRLGYGSAACELLFLLLPEDQAQNVLYTYFVSFLRQVSRSDKRTLPALFIAFFLRLMSQLGYAPSIAYCSGCNREFTEFADENKYVLFSPERGGLVCRTCQKAGEYYIRLSVEGARLMVALQKASLDEAALLPIRYEDATVLIGALAKFLKYHSGLVSDIKSLRFLDKLKNSQTGS